MKVAVIGGGIGGLACAAGLAASGHEVAVFERSAALSEVGAGISLWCNASASLARLGLGELPAAIGYPLTTALNLSPTGRELTRIDIEPIDREVGAPSVAVHRLELQQTLFDRLPRGCVQFGAE